MDNTSLDEIKRAADIISRSEAILIGAGAGMGVDSGLPAFRDETGLWRAYPVAKRLGLHFAELATPELFERNPRLAWGFYGHRFNLYRDTIPHTGYQILKDWCQRKPQGGFVYTSNVDGHFQKAGFDEDQIVECHGSIFYWQCSTSCRHGIWHAPEAHLDIDEESLLLQSPLPRCPGCGSVARPNIAMFDDRLWDPGRTRDQMQDLWHWIQAAQLYRLVVLEIGAGNTILTVRRFCAQFGTIIRINPTADDVGKNGIAIRADALSVLQAIDHEIRRLG